MGRRSSAGSGDMETPKGASCLVFLAVMAAAHAYGRTDYCSFNYNHTMCRYKGISPYCGENSFGGSLTENEKKVILDTHNRLRSMIASGAEQQGAPGPQPPASDMQILQWDDELAEIAQRWADQCFFEHDDFRNTLRFSVGQNLFQSEGGVPWEEAIYSWYSEVEFFDKNLVDNFIVDNATGHYTQLVWANTRYIGCGKRTYPQNRRRFRRDTTLTDGDILRHLEQGEYQSDEDSVRQTRKINYNSNYNNYHTNRNSYNWNTHQYYQKPTTQSPENDYESQWKAYNRSLHEYYEKYKNVLQNKNDYKTQLQLYKDYLEQAVKLDSTKNQENKASTFNKLLNKYEMFKNIHNRQQYYDRKLKHKLANKKRLNPVVSKNYAFTTERPIIPGIEYEYYVCNYGPAGNFPGARMYTKGVSRCPYYGLCSDPLTREYYPSLEVENDPILSVLYSSQRK